MKRYQIGGEIVLGIALAAASQGCASVQSPTDQSRYETGSPQAPSPTERTPVSPERMREYNDKLTQLLDTHVVGSGGYRSALSALRTEYADVAAEYDARRNKPREQRSTPQSSTRIRDPILDAVVPTRAVEPPLPRPTVPEKSEAVGLFRHYGGELRHFLVEPPKSDQYGWAKRYVLNLPNGALWLIDHTVGQLDRLRDGTPSGLSGAYEKHVPTSVQTALGAEAWREAFRVAVDKNWISEGDAIPQFFNLSDHEPGTRPVPPSPTSSPPSGLENPTNTGSGNAGSDGLGLGGGEIK